MRVFVLAVNYKAMMCLSCSHHAVDVQFDDATSSIKLSGLSNDVVTVEALVQTTYVKAVFWVCLDLRLPGVVIM